MKVLAVWLLAVVTATTVPVKPDAKLTPGDVDKTATTHLICTTTTRSRRDVTESEKSLVLNQYEHKFGIIYPKPYGQTLEFDHLISLELGGSNSNLNLWPEPLHASVGGKDVGAKTKDFVENALHKAVCANKIKLDAAQHLISTDWIAAYKHYVGPLPEFKR